MATLSKVLVVPVTTPENASFQGKGAEEIRNVKVLLQERLDLDHNFDGTSNDTESASCDGYHKRVTLKTLGVTSTVAMATPATYLPAIDTDAGILAMCTDGVFWFVMVGSGVIGTRIV
jgi:hypothetical protein